MVKKFLSYDVVTPFSLSLSFSYQSIPVLLSLSLSKHSAVSTLSLESPSLSLNFLTHVVLFITCKHSHFKTNNHNIYSAYACFVNSTLNVDLCVSQSVCVYKMFFSRTTYQPLTNANHS